MGNNMKFEDYYKEFCEVFGHPLWILPMFVIGFFVFVETMHLNYHAHAERDAHGYCKSKNLINDDY